MENSTGRKMIKVSLNRSIDLLGIPFMQFEKGSETLRFILDTGASLNFIKKDVLEKFSEDAVRLDTMIEYFGVDNVGHKTNLYSFNFKLGEYLYSEEFQEMQNADALNFELEEGRLEVHGLLGTPFFRKYHACFSYDSMEMYFSVPDKIAC